MFSKRLARKHAFEKYPWHEINVFENFIFSILRRHPLCDPILILLQYFREKKLPPHKMYLAIFNTDLKYEKNGFKIKEIKNF